MSSRFKIYLLLGLLALAGLAYFVNRYQVPGLPGVLAADPNFTPLSVQEPQLRLDLLARLKQEIYTGIHRDIFSLAPPPIEPAVAGAKKIDKPVIFGPQQPPPFQVPGEFFGYALMRQSGLRVAFFKEGDDVLVVPEGDTFLLRFRLIHIATDSADVLEIATGRHATVTMVSPVTGEQGSTP